MVTAGPAGLKEGVELLLRQPHTRRVQQLRHGQQRPMHRLGGRALGVLQPGGRHLHVGKHHADDVVVRHLDGQLQQNWQLGRGVAPVPRLLCGL